ncbi:MAG: hypothetical protein HOO08_05630 [Opitutae bacterium]|nr:hypothetical protein [Opitutae bacterium]
MVCGGQLRDVYSLWPLFATWRRVAGQAGRGYAEWIQGNGNINEKGGNLLLNVGPDGNGLIQPEAIAILKQTAELLEAAPIHKKIPLVTQVPGIKVK